MRLTVFQPLPALLLLLIVVVASAAGRPAGATTVAPAPSTQSKIDLYSPRVRRATVSYLRLRLLELREQNLDRARAAIERRLSLDELISPTQAPRVLDERPSAAHSIRAGSTRKSSP